MANTHTFNLIDLDVWGNEHEGWEVNAAYRTGFSVDLTLKQWEDDHYLLEYVIKTGYLTAKAREFVEIDCDGGSILTFIDSRDGKPLYQLEMQ